MQREYDRLVRVCQGDNVKLPTKRQVEKKATQLHKLMESPVTEVCAANMHVVNMTELSLQTEIAAMIARKKMMMADKRSISELTMERARLNQQLHLAQRRQDEEEAFQLREQLAAIEAEMTSRNSGLERQQEETLADKLAKVNERNRKANAEAIRNVELREAERRRKEKLAHANGTATPTTPYDPSARLRTVPKLFNPRLVSCLFLLDACLVSMSNGR